jgi:6-phosphogluconate dehydrogenase
MDIQQIGVVGLGRMGGGLALAGLRLGLRVVGFTLGAVPDELANAGLVAVDGMAQFHKALAPPRVVMLYIPAGPPVDEAIETLCASLEPGDIIVDGGNSYWGDSIRRHALLRRRGFNFIDLGTSGGISGAREGACFMAGGEVEVVARIEPILKALAVPGGYVHAGPPGAGHFVKLVHNGIEFGMLQAIGEGVDLLAHYRDKLDVAKVLECWRHGSVIRSWLIDLLTEAYQQDPGLSQPSGYIEDTGEVNWLVGDAIQMEVPVPVIAQSVMQLFASRDSVKTWAKAIIAMRHGFGGHPFGPNEAVARERHEGRVGDLFRTAAKT